MSGRLTDHLAIGVLTGLIHRDIVDDVIRECGKREKRSRLLPAHVVMYYVLALNLFFGEAYEEVMRQLVNGLRFLGNWREGWEVPSTSAISQARTRLGEAPMKLLFERIAVPMARKHSHPALTCGFAARWRGKGCRRHARAGGAMSGLGRSGRRGVGWDPGSAEDCFAQCVHHVVAVLGGGRQVSPDAVAVLGALLAGETSGDLLLGLAGS